MFRTLRADEIDCRVQTVKQNGCSVLLYKDARCDMNILDETVGPLDWKREHLRDNANCIVSLWDDKKQQWVSKEDTGKESYTEKEKGLASDSFKRACFNWGIGRELYTSPFIWIKFNEGEVKSKEYNGKTTYYPAPGFKLKISMIDYNENREVRYLKIVDNKGNVRFTYGQHSEDPAPKDDNVYTNNTSAQYACSGCNCDIDERVAKYSYGKYKKLLCRDCQKKMK